MALKYIMSVFCPPGAQVQPGRGQRGICWPFWRCFRHRAQSFLVKHQTITAAPSDLRWLWRLSAGCRASDELGAVWGTLWRVAVSTGVIKMWPDSVKINALCVCVCVCARECSANNKLFGNLRASYSLCKCLGVISDVFAIPYHVSRWVGWCW